MSSLLKKYFDEYVSNDRLGHAFLICNATYDIIKDDLDEVLSNHFFNGKKSNEVFNDFILISPLNSKILKDDILDLQSKLKLKSTENLNRVYVIDGADKMNDYASNSLLKFLEEPEENIYAFLICENLNKVLPTIRSRCHIIILENRLDFSIDDYDEELVNKAVSIIKMVEEKKTDCEPYVFSILDEKEDRENVQKIINIIKYFYYNALNYKILNENAYFKEYTDLMKYVLNNNDGFVLTNKLISVNKMENMLEYNVNINLFFDKLIYELGSGKHE